MPRRYVFVGHTFAEAREAIRRARLGPVGRWLEDRADSMCAQPFGRFVTIRRAELDMDDYFMHLPSKEAPHAKMPSELTAMFDEYMDALLPPGYYREMLARQSGEEAKDA